MTESLPQSPPSNRMTPDPGTTPSEFPNGNARDGVVYQLANPANPLQQLAIMSMETYMKTGTLIQSLRGVAGEQDRRIKELLAELDVSKQYAASIFAKLENLRAVRRAEKRPEVEAQVAATVKSLITPKGDSPAYKVGE